VLGETEILTVRGCWSGSLIREDVGGQRDW